MPNNLKHYSRMKAKQQNAQSATWYIIHDSRITKCQRPAQRPSVKIVSQRTRRLQSSRVLRPIHVPPGHQIDHGIHTSLKPIPSSSPERQHQQEVIRTAVANATSSLHETPCDQRFQSEHGRARCRRGHPARNEASFAVM